MSRCQWCSSNKKTTNLMIDNLQKNRIMQGDYQWGSIKVSLYDLNLKIAPIKMIFQKMGSKEPILHEVDQTKGEETLHWKRSLLESNPCAKRKQKMCHTISTRTNWRPNLRKSKTNGSIWTVSRKEHKKSSFLCCKKSKDLALKTKILWKFLSLSKSRLSGKLNQCWRITIEFLEQLTGCL